MLLPLRLEMSIAGPGAVNVGRALYLVTLSVTAAATSPPPPVSEPDGELLQAASTSAETESASTPRRCLLWLLELVIANLRCPSLRRGRCRGAWSLDSRGGIRSGIHRVPNNGIDAT